MPWLDLSMLAEKRFRLQFMALVLGLINIIVTFSVYHPRVRDEMYLSVVCTCFIISVNYHILLMLSCIQSNWGFVMCCDVVFHLLAALFLLGESIQYLISTNHIVCVGCASYFARRYCSLFIGFLCSTLYGIAGMILLEFRLRTGDVTCGGQEIRRNP